MISKNQQCIFWSILAVAGMAGMSYGDQGIEIDGVIGMDPIGEESALAVYVPVEAGQALAGIAWYNNDGAVVFPEILVAGGDAGYPEPIGNAVVVSHNVAGSTSDWSELEFSQPIASDSDGLYVVFVLPIGSDYQHDGYGGGSALGYTSSEDGYPGWFTDDGGNWVMLHESYGMAIQPTYVLAEEWMLVKSMPAGQIAPVVEEVTALLPAAPNPFNPSTEIRFALNTPSMVKLAIYDLRGQLVKHLAAETYPAGTHNLTWTGVDEDGRRVASGTYVVTYKAGGIVQSQRLVLVK
jgi:hypothetical protein